MNDDNDILDRLHRARPLARGPYCRLIDDSITEIEQLRFKLAQQESETVDLRRDLPA
jgi:hypothetical protein